MNEIEAAKALSECEHPPLLACTGCGSMIGSGPDWRWNGKSWEHRCADASPYLGHFTPNLISPKQLFAELKACLDRVQELEDQNGWILEDVRYVLGKLTGSAIADNVRLRAWLVGIKSLLERVG